MTRSSRPIHSLLLLLLAVASATLCACETAALLPTCEDGTIAAISVAHWNGRQWEAMGDGLIGQVFALAVDTTSGVVYAGGRFTNSGSTLLSNIARWDPGRRVWESLGLGVDGPVSTIAMHGSEVFVGGSFERAINEDGSSIVGDGLARWDGSRWSTVGTFRSRYVSKLVVRGDKLFVACDPITTAPAASCDLSTGTWTPVSLADGPINAIALNDSFIYTAGRARVINSIATSICEEQAADGSMQGVGSFTQPDGVGGCPYADDLLLVDDELYVIGCFESIDGKAADGMARWNRVSRMWTPVTGIAGSPKQLGVYMGRVVIAGWFGSFEGTSTSGLALYDPLTRSISTLGRGVCSELNGNPLAAGLNAIASHGNDLYVGGDFNRIGIP